MMKWCRERGLALGDTIVFERLAERRYRLTLEKAAPAG
jgi:glycine cleavage system aminomethyltransferase T